MTMKEEIEMKEPIHTIGVLTSGGDCSGLNTAIPPRKVRSRPHYPPTNIWKAPKSP